MRISPIPPFECLVRGEYLGVNQYVEGIAYGIVCREGYGLAFSVHLSTGALWYDVPIQGVCLKPCEELLPHEAQMWDCISEDVSVVAYPYLKNFIVDVQLPKDTCRGTYLFTIDYKNSFYADHPREHKTDNVIVLNGGQIVAYPNYRMLVHNTTMTEITEWPKYKPTKKLYSPENSRLCAETDPISKSAVHQNSDMSYLDQRPCDPKK